MIAIATPATLPTKPKPTHCRHCGRKLPGAKQRRRTRARVKPAAAAAMIDAAGELSEAQGEARQQPPQPQPKPERPSKPAKPPYEPTPEQIAAATAEIRAGWSEDEHRLRRRVSGDAGDIHQANRRRSPPGFRKPDRRRLAASLAAELHWTPPQVDAMEWSQRIWSDE